MSETVPGRLPGVPAAKEHPSRAVTRWRGLGAWGSGVQRGRSAFHCIRSPVGHGLFQKCCSVFSVPGESGAPAFELTGPGGPHCSESACSSIPPQQVMKESPRSPHLLPSATLTPSSCLELA